MKLIQNLITLFQGKADQGGDYQMSTVTLDRSIPAIHDLSNVNVNVSGSEKHAVGQ